MKDNKTGMIIREYFNIISPLLPFMPDSRIGEIERKILLLLCKSKNCTDIIDECSALIDDARCLQSYSDSTLLLTTDAAQHNIAYDIKTEVLGKNKINKLRSFDEIIFAEDLKNAADIGDKNSCKLLAFLSWLGLVVEENKNAAQNIWAALSMSGDRPSIEMLIYAYAKTRNIAALKKWNNIKYILQHEFESFSAIALYSTYPEFSEEEIQTANLIMFISQKYSGKEAINRPMLYYALNSKDDYKTKMDKLSSETNYYIALHDEDKISKKQCGFLVSCLE